LAGKIAGGDVTNDPVQPEPAPSRRRVSPVLVIAVILIVLVVIGGFQNTDSSDVDFLWMDFSAPLWVWFLVLFLLGLAVGWIANMVRERRKRKRASR
jgi:uncharacterized integral membrane protein